MRAAVLRGKDDVRVETVPVPRPLPGEVLVRTERALTCGTDAKVLRRGYHARMLVPPTLFGHELVGTVEEVGPGVTAFEAGDRVVPANSAPCGRCSYCAGGRESLCDDLLFWNGAYAEYACIPARIVSQNLLRVPEDLDPPWAALVEPLACAVQGIERSRVAPGASVAVIGTGPMGLLFVALARLQGGRVVAVGRRESRLALARAMGAEQTVLVGEGQDLGVRLREATPGGLGADVVVEAVGLATTAAGALDGVRKGGLVNLFAGCADGAKLPLDAARLHYEEISLVSSFHHTPASIREALRLLSKRAIPVERLVTGEAPLENLPEVLGRMGTGDELKTAIVP
jgi:L-iditol 2-dehydrogenase